MNTLKKNYDLIITSRMGSSRLPGKALKKFHQYGEMLRVLVERASRSKKFERVIVATTEKKEDDILADWSQDMGYFCFRGSENDVLGRLAGAARQFASDNIIEILGDNPLVTPKILDACIELFESNKLAYSASATIEYGFSDKARCYPIGVRIQIMTADFLSRLDNVATTESQREHATSIIYEDPEFDRIELSYPDADLAEKINPNWNFAVNTAADFQRVEKILHELGLHCDLEEIVEFTKIERLFETA